MSHKNEYIHVFVWLYVQMHIYGYECLHMKMYAQIFVSQTFPIGTPFSTHDYSRVLALKDKPHFQTNDLDDNVYDSIHSILLPQKCYIRLASYCFACDFLTKKGKKPFLSKEK
jgi:hypothetical protein